MGEGHGLALRPRNALAGAPPILGLCLTGYGLTNAERDLATQLGISPNEWSFDGSTALAEELAGADQGLRRDLEANVLSSDGVRGQTVLFADDRDYFGVLVELDVTRSPDPPLEEFAPAEPITKVDTTIDELVPASTDLITLVVIECKAPGTPLTANVLDQAEHYASRLGAIFIAVTDGTALEVFQRSSHGKRTKITKLPAYSDVLAGRREVVESPPEEPPPPLPACATSCRDLVRLHRRYRSGTIGSATKEPLWLPILALDDALRGSSFGSEYVRHGIRFIDDHGVNVRAPGSAMGAWHGEYRDFLIEDAAGNRLVFGVSILGAWQTADSLRASGSRVHSGWSYIIVGTSDDGVYESTLQLALDKHLHRVADGWQLRHDGALTAGKGAVARETLFEALRQRTPFLVNNRCVVLGTVREGSVDPDRAQDLLARLAAYAVVRRDVKQDVKTARAASRFRR